MECSICSHRKKFHNFVQFPKKPSTILDNLSKSIKIVSIKNWNSKPKSKDSIFNLYWKKFQSYVISKKPSTILDNFSKGIKITNHSFDKKLNQQSKVERWNVQSAAIEKSFPTRFDFREKQRQSLLTSGKVWTLRIIVAIKDDRRAGYNARPSCPYLPVRVTRTQ